MIKQEKIDELFDKIDNIVLIEYKNCTKCKKRKKLSEFGKKSSNKGGLKYYCKKCIRTYNRRYARKRYKNRTKEWKEKRAEYMRKYSIENKERIVLNNKLWKNKNREHLSKQSSEYHKKRMSCDKEYAKKYKERIKEYKKREYVIDAHKKRNREYGRRQIKQLGDCYIKSCIAKEINLSHLDITEEAVMLKKASLKLKRMIIEVENK